MGYLQVIFKLHFFCYFSIITKSPFSAYLLVIFLDILVGESPILLCVALQRRIEAERSRASCVTNTAHAWMATRENEWERVSQKESKREGGRVGTAAEKQQRISSCFKGWLSWQPITIGSLYPWQDPFQLNEWCHQLWLGFCSECWLKYSHNCFLFCLSLSNLYFISPFPSSNGHKTRLNMATPTTLDF